LNGAPLVLALAVIGFAAAFHLYWALGGKTGLAVSLPQNDDGQPVLGHLIGWWRAGALAVSVALALLALLILALRGWIELPLALTMQRLAVAAVGIVFCLRVLVPSRYVGFFKTIRHTRWAKYDTRFYSPLFLILGLSLLALALG
jgi:hypothetical protein